MRKLNILIATTILMSAITIPAYAGQWVQDTQGWRYQDDSQTFLTSQWFQDKNGAWYYLDHNGYMKTNTFTADAYVVGSDGVYIAGMGQDHDLAVSPWNYQKMLGRGMDVDWSKVKEGRESYNTKTVADFKYAGIDHVRIRVKDDLNQELLESLDRQINDCLSHGIIPVLAYQADDFKNNPSQSNMNQVTQWWKTIAERYQSKSHLLSFDLMIESSDALNKQPEALNQMYEQTVAAIRQTNPDRIIMISPRLRSDPAYLSELKIPSASNGYLMAEWHFYASGPSKTNSRKLWTTGTEAEKQLITDKIAYALTWQQNTGIPTWVGAWMAGNYNDGNDYTLDEQIHFADFMCSSLQAAGIPFAVNSDTKFYDRITGQWITEMEPLRQYIFKR